MTGRAAKDSRRRAPSDALRDLHGDIERLTEGITVTSATRPVEPAATLFTPARPRQAPPTELADDVDPLSRPWTPDAAREPLPPASPEELAARLGPGQEPGRRSLLMTAVVVAAAVAAIFVLIASHLDLGHTATPSFAVNDLSATKDAADTSVTVAGHFLATAPQIDIEAAYIGAGPGDQLTIRVLFAGGVFAEQRYDLSPGSGTVPAPLTPKDATEFKPGTYTINAVWHGSTVRTAQFSVDAPAPSTPGVPAGTPSPQG